MPSRLTDVFAQVATFSQRKAGMTDPAVERRRIKAVEREQRRRVRAPALRAESLVEDPVCDDSTYSNGYLKFEEGKDDRLKICATTIDGEFANRPLAFADEAPIRVVANTGPCDVGTASDARVAKTVSIDLPVGSWDCLITASASVSGDVDLNVTAPCVTGWVAATREPTTGGAGAHGHALSGSTAGDGAHRHLVIGDTGGAIVPHVHGIGGFTGSGSGSHRHDVDGYTSYTQNNHRHWVPKIKENTAVNKSSDPDENTDHRHGITADTGWTNNGHNHPLPDDTKGSSTTSHSHGVGTLGTASEQNHTHAGGSLSADNASNHSHATTNDGSITLQQVCRVTGNFTAKLEYKSVDVQKTATCRSASISALCWQTS